MPSQKGSSQKMLIYPESILKARFTEDKMIVGVSKEGYLISYIWIPKAHDINPSTPFTCGEEKKKKYDNRTKFCGLDLYDRSIKKFDFPILLLNNGKYIVRGGFWDGKIAVSPLDNELTVTYGFHHSTVTVLVADQSEKTVISGSKGGDVIVWHVPQSDHIWVVKRHLSDHDGQVSSIVIRDDMAVFVTASLDGTANLYSLCSVKLVRTFKHPQLSPIYSVI